MKEIDARGLACPAPVLQTKAAVEQEGIFLLKVLVDNEASRQNVMRFLESKGFSVSLEGSGENLAVIGTGGNAPAPEAPATPRPQTDRCKILVLCSSDRIGSGDDDLGRALMVNFIKTLGEMGPDLWRLVFVNSGVKLAVEGSAVLGTLQRYEEGGLSVLVCGTCLNHFRLLEKKKVGETTNMLDIVTAMQLADKVINV